MSAGRRESTRRDYYERMLRVIDHRQEPREPRVFARSGRALHRGREPLPLRSPGGNPGEDHRDIGYISFDSTRGKHVLRQFHVEGFVNQYVHESTSEDGKTIVFVTEAIENIPPGWRARETYVLAGPDELIERFELAEPGKEFELYPENRLRRVAPR